jgi:hypothetical protein
MISVTVRHIIMALPLFVVSTVGRALWNKISKESVTTRLTKYSPRPLLPYKCYTHTKAPNWVSRGSGTDFRNRFVNNQSKYH